MHMYARTVPYDNYQVLNGARLHTRFRLRDISLPLPDPPSTAIKFDEGRRE